jgi:hypothetical protein
MSGWDEMTQEILRGSLPPVRDSPGALESAASELLHALAADAAIAQVTGRRYGAFKGLVVGHDLISRSFAFLAVLVSLKTASRHLPPPPRESELRHAEADLHEHLSEVAEKLPEVEQAADNVMADPEKSRLVKHIAKAVKRTASGLSPAALLVLLWWLFAIRFRQEADTDIAVLALWYAVARDLLKKDD